MIDSRKCPPLLSALNVTKTSVSFISSLWQFKESRQSETAKLRNVWNYQPQNIAVHGDVMRELSCLLAEEGNEFVCTTFWAVYPAVQSVKRNALALWSICKTYSTSLTTSAWEILLIFRHFAEVKLHFLFNCWHAGLQCVAPPLCFLSSLVPPVGNACLQEWFSHELRNKAGSVELLLCCLWDVQTGLVLSCFLSSQVNYFFLLLTHLQETIKQSFWSND